MMMADLTRIVEHKGIRVGNEYYMAPQLQQIGGEQVQIRYMPHDRRSIEVFTEDGHLCTARVTRELDREDRKAVLEFRHAAKRAAAKQKAKASRAANARTEPLTGKTPVVDITVITERSAKQSPRSRKGLSDRKSDELLEALGLSDELNTSSKTNRTVRGDNAV